MVNKRLIGLLGESKKYIALHVFINWISLLSNILIVVYVSILLQRALNNEIAVGNILTASAIILAALVIRFICNYNLSTLSYKLSTEVKRDLRTNIYKKLFKIGTAYSQRVSTSETIQVAVEGVEQLEAYFGKFLPQLFYSILAPATLFAVLSFISIKASVVLLICVPLIPAVIIIIQRFAKKMMGKYWGDYINLGETFLENLQGLTTLKIYGTDKVKNDEMNRAAEGFRRITMKVLTMQLNSIAVMDLIAFGGTALGVIVSVLQFVQGEIEFSGAISIILLSAEFFIPLRLLGSFFHVAMNGIAASGKIFRIMDLEEETVKTEIIENAHIKISNLDFSYDGSKRILKGISIDVPRGGFISIVGESGSGKSTVASLITGQIKGYKGSLMIGGSEIREIKEDSVMRHITAIGHNSYIFKGTIQDNLRMGNPHASKVEMISALKRANLYEFFSWKEGLSKELEERGANLSGGQRQRLALARALLHDSDIYIFDEATSNIDVESEDSIMKTILALAGKKTVILISHRLANVEKSDEIYVLRNGEIIESGKHMDLINRKGYYSKLYFTQYDIEQYAKGGGIYA
ncbi:MAG: ABC transporter ATP-binding protein/permease [Maledivibacter sp.]|jgi:ABC-type transport system involved in cytochrome bd biosynthesis fused ATPase/permease subunit|nr:ABC transporter ATP-binding protein/permease [Maledivibacter sp.]